AAQSAECKSTDLNGPLGQYADICEVVEDLAQQAQPLPLRLGKKVWLQDVYADKDTLVFVTDFRITKFLIPRTFRVIERNNLKDTCIDNEALIALVNGGGAVEYRYRHVEDKAPIRTQRVSKFSCDKLTKPEPKDGADSPPQRTHARLPGCALQSTLFTGGLPCGRAQKSAA
ncbi:MAG: hypothetical protein ACR2RB_16460, partial [Gammaproteobacteria bacterium]